MLGTYLIILVTVEYTLAGIAYAYQRDFGSGLMFLAYALANIGYFWQKGMFN
jgi:hypothetical protein